MRARAAVPPGANQALHIGLHQHLQHRLGDAAKEVTVSCFRQQVRPWQSVVGHRVVALLHRHVEGVHVHVDDLADRGCHGVGGLTLLLCSAYHARRIQVPRPRMESGLIRLGAMPVALIRSFSPRRR